MAPSIAGPKRPRTHPVGGRPARGWLLAGGHPQSVAPQAGLDEAGAESFPPATPSPSTTTVRATSGDGTPQAFTTTVRIDTPAEAGYYRHGGVLQYLLRQLLEQ